MTLYALGLVSSQKTEQQKSKLTDLEDLKETGT